MKKITFYLDFDGTVCEFNFPQIGRENFPALEVVKKIMEAGHEVVLNTYRADLDSESLQKALGFINFNFRTELPRKIEALKNKVHPPLFRVDDFIDSGIFFIDDQCVGTPLKPAVSHGNEAVDFVRLEEILREKGLI